MSTWIALFRGINVGGKHILPMSELVRHLNALGLNNVRTYIQSGNAVFEASPKAKVSATLGEEIAAKIEQAHGFRPYVLILSADAWARAVQSNPFPGAEADPKTLHLFFLASAPAAPDMETLSEKKLSSEQFQLDGRVFYLHAPDGIGRSKLAARVEKLLGVRATARNWRTVQKLWEMAKTK